jgi:hypothetical protein
VVKSWSIRKDFLDVGSELALNALSLPLFAIYMINWSHRKGIQNLTMFLRPVSTRRGPLVENLPQTASPQISRVHLTSPDFQFWRRRLPSFAQGKCLVERSIEVLCPGPHGFGLEPRRFRLFRFGFGVQ